MVGRHAAGAAVAAAVSAKGDRGADGAGQASVGVHVFHVCVCAGPLNLPGGLVLLPINLPVRHDGFGWAHGRHLRGLVHLLGLPLRRRGIAGDGVCQVLAVGGQPTGGKDGRADRGHGQRRIRVGRMASCAVAFGRGRCRLPQLQGGGLQLLHRQRLQLQGLHISRASPAGVWAPGRRQASAAASRGAAPALRPLQMLRPAMLALR
mmetsp:Transcript_13622/g.24332  ORF Transcript_13622/g.24332 Transcript_13622/m.24332 type:complete len:206 (+) Transcript_13622:760-1377(+)